MAKIKIFKGAVPKKEKKSAPAPKQKEAPPSLLGKTVMFALANGQRIAGVVRGKMGGVLTVAYAIPNSQGILIVAKDATTMVHEDDVLAIDAVAVEGRDVKAWESREPLQAVKAATEIKNGNTVVDYNNVTFEGYGSTFQGTTPADRDGDYIVPGAFDDSIRRFRENPVLLTDHVRAVRHMMGHYEQISINERGLAMKGVVTNSPHPDAVHVRFQLVEGSLKTLSIGGSFFYRDDYRGIEEIDLHETSLVVVPANPDASFQVRQIDGDFAEKAFKAHAKRHGGEVRYKFA